MINSRINFEIRRKIFHLCSLIFPVAYIFMQKLSMAIALTIITGITLYLDISRHYNHKIRIWVEKLLGRFLREKEDSGQFTLSGASFMAFGLLLSCLMFSKGLTITSWFVFIISDCAASLVGLKFGVPLFNGKTLAGSIAFFTSAVLIGILSYFTIGFHTTFFTILLSALATTLVEFFSNQIKIDDNFSIPIVYGLVTVLTVLTG